MTRPRRLAPLAAAGVALLLAACGQEADTAPASYSMEEVAQHAAVDSCWTVVDGGVYDVTDYVSLHPGGEARVQGMCGQDATEDYLAFHEGGENAVKVLERYRIGTLD